jgi:hypothetical protein
MIAAKATSSLDEQLRTMIAAKAASSLDEQLRMMIVAKVWFGSGLVLNSSGSCCHLIVLLGSGLVWCLVWFGLLSAWFGLVWVWLGSEQH